MFDGIYHVTFSSNFQDSGEGITVVKDDSINGGDYGYIYTGTKNEDGENFSCTLAIKQWNPAAQSVFGPVKEFTLELTGSANADSGFLAHGHIVGQPQAKISIRGRYLSAVS